MSRQPEFEIGKKYRFFFYRPVLNGEQIYSFVNFEEIAEYVGFRIETYCRVEKVFLFRKENSEELIEYPISLIPAYLECPECDK